MRLPLVALFALAGCTAPPEPVDTDGDHIPDAEDAFPANPFETRDADGDGVGDRADTDDATRAPRGVAGDASAPGLADRNTTGS